MASRKRRCSASLQAILGLVMVYFLRCLRSSPSSIPNISKRTRTDLTLHTSCSLVKSHCSPGSSSRDRTRTRYSDTETRKFFDSGGSGYSSPKSCRESRGEDTAVIMAVTKKSVTCRIWKTYIVTHSSVIRFSSRKFKPTSYLRLILDRMI